jgi:putative transposase
MPRSKRVESKTGIYHWINRGINQKKLFHKKDDFEFFLSLVGEHKNGEGIDIYHYCLMSNHIHLLLRSPDMKALASFSHYVQRRYAYHYCRNYKWRGQVFQRMYKSLPVEKESYLMECGRYIERNPVRANLVKKAGEYPYSSFNFYAHSKPDSIITASPMFLALSNSLKIRNEQYKAYVSDGRAYEEILDGALLGV